MNIPSKQGASDAPLSKSGRYWLLAIIVMAITIRLTVAFYLGDRVVPLPGTFDQVSYDMVAQRVLNGHGFTVAEDWWPATPAGEPTAHWSYLYTLFLVGVYSLVGYQPLIARFIQASLAGLLMPWLTYRLGQRHFNPKVGLAAAAVMAFYAYFVYYAANLMTETFYITSILWTLDVAGQLGQGVKQGQSSSMRRLTILLGLALAVTILLRQVFLLFVPILFLWLLWLSYRHQVRPFKQMLGSLIAATLILIAAIVPWTLRNYQTFNQFVLLNTNAGFAFYWANHEIHGYNFQSLIGGNSTYHDLIPPELRGLNEAELDRALLKRGLALVQADPMRYLILSTSRVKDYFKFWPSANSGMISNIARIFSFGVLWPFMVYGFFVSLRQPLSNKTLLLHLFVVVYTGVHLLSWALIRYRLPVDAVLLVFAGLALVALQERLAPSWFKAFPILKFSQKPQPTMNQN